MADALRDWIARVDPTRPDPFGVNAELRERLLAEYDARQAYSKDQPRVPAGNPLGGQWTDGGVQAPASGFARTDTKAFKAWFKDSKVVDEDGKPLVVYHGTVQDFAEFDPAKTGVEADWGAGFYFSDGLADVNANYARVGPDLEQKLGQLADEISNEYTDNPPPGWEDLTSREQQHLVEQEARRRMVQHGGSLVPVYLSMQHPAVLERGSANETSFSFDEHYDEASDSYDEPTGTLVDFVTHFKRIATSYTDASPEAINDVTGALFTEALDKGGSVGLSDLRRVIADHEGFAYASNDQGRLAVAETIRRTLAALGYDGIIDRRAGEKFKNMEGVRPDTTHYIVFRPEQIKSVWNRGTWSPTAKNISLRAKVGPIIRWLYDPTQPRVPAGTSTGGQWSKGSGSGGTRFEGPDAARLQTALATLPPAVLREAGLQIFSGPQPVVDAKMEEYLLRYYNYSYASEGLPGTYHAPKPVALVDRARGVAMGTPEQILGNLAHALPKRTASARLRAIADRLQMRATDVLNRALGLVMGHAAQEVLSLTNPITAIIEREVVQDLFRKWGWQ